MKTEDQFLQVNGRSYRWPSRPVVADFIDGRSPDYLENLLAARILPNFASFKKEDFFS